MNDKLQLDIDDLTIGEVVLVEEIIGDSIDVITKPNARRGKTLQALALVAARRLDPAATLESVSSMKVSDLELVDAPKASKRPAKP